MAGHAHAHPHLPLADFANELRQAGLDALDSTDSTTSLSAVLSWSLHSLTAQQRTTFAMVGIAPGPDISLSAAASLTGLALPQARTVLRDLVNASLLHRKAHDRYTMHDLIRAYATTLAQELAEEIRRTGLRRLLDFYTTHSTDAADRLLELHRPLPQSDLPVPDVRPESLPRVLAAMNWFDTEYACLLAAQRVAAAHAWHSTVWRLAWTLYTFHNRRGLRHDQLAVWRTALEAAAHLSAPVTRVIAHRAVGHAYIELGHHDKAVGHIYQALTLAEEHHDIYEQARTHRTLGRAWELRKDYQRALEHATRYLDLVSTLDHPAEQAIALSQVGWYAAVLGEYETAYERCQAALALHRHHHNPGGEASTLDSLGYITRHTGQHQQAVGWYQQAVTLSRALGHAHLSADVLDQLGHAHVDSGDREQALAAWREALELYRQQGRDQDADRVQRQLENLNAHNDGKY